MTYEYKCKDCGHVQEKFGVPASQSDEPTKCEKCGGVAERLMSPVSHSLKYYKRLYGKRVDEGKPGFGGKP